MPVFSLSKNKQGIGLVEILVGIGIFLIFALGVYGLLQFTFKSVYNSRIRLIQTSILNEQIEMARNMPYHEVGIVNGSPTGTLDRTLTISRNGIEFEITRTIRNIDDPFDGTIELGTDPSPADYKLFEVEVICAECGQQVPTRLSTYVQPKYLEGDPTNGALFVEVLDANGVAVQGATVRVWSPSTTPVIDITDTTNNFGKLSLVDLPPGQNVYHIEVSKAGYSSDSTVTSSVQNPNPTKPPRSVIAQTVGSVTFSIDTLSSMEIETINSLCTSVGNVSLDISGAELTGTEPDVLRLEESVQTDANGELFLANYKWDDYSFQVNGYDMIGTVPITQILLAPGQNQPVSILVGPDTAHSLVVHVQNSINKEPISGAQVSIGAVAIATSTELTGIGHARQTDWSAGSGQTEYVNQSQYFSDDGNIDVISSPGNIMLAENFGSYPLTGTLESSIFDLGLAVNFVDLNWEPLSQPIATGADSLKFQIATNSSSLATTTWNYVGPDGTDTSFFTVANRAVSSTHDGDRYFRYKVFFETTSNTNTPTLSDLSMSYTTSCQPPGQVYFGDISNTTYDVQITADGYDPFFTIVDVDGNTSLITELNEQG